MHPVHVRGFLQQSGLDESQVQWIHRENAETLYLRQLTRKKLIEVKEKRRKLRQKRVNKRDRKR